MQGGSMQAPGGGGGLLYPAPLRTPVGLNDGASGISPRGQLTSSGGRPYPAPIMNLPRNTMDYNLHSLGGPDPLLPHLLNSSSSGGGGAGRPSTIKLVSVLTPVIGAEELKETD